MATKTEKRKPKAAEPASAWHVIDAEGKTLGRLSSEIAVLLQGKGKPQYVPYLNTGDYVIVVNAEKIRVTGEKLEKKIYYRHSGYHGGLTERKLKDVLARTPTRVIKAAVKGMLPKSRLGRSMLSRLKLYAGAEHPHAAQVNVRPRVAREPAAGPAQPQMPEPEDAMAAAETAVADETATPDKLATAAETAVAEEATADQESPPKTRRRPAASTGEVAKADQGTGDSAETESGPKAKEE